MNSKDFGLRLKQLRNSHSLTQSQLASKIDMSRQAYVNYELGRCMPPAEIIAKLSQVFGVDLMEMLYNHTTFTFSQSQEIVASTNRDDFFTMYELYSKLSPLSQKRIFTLLNILSKGGDE